MILTPCSSCGGTGAVRCTHCGGCGINHHSNLLNDPCRGCAGAGKEKCRTCQGTGQQQYADEPIVNYQANRQRD